MTRILYVLLGALLASPLVTEVPTRGDSAADTDPRLTCGQAADPDLCVHETQPPPPGIDPRRRPKVDELKQRRRGQPAAAEVAGGDAGEAEVAPSTWPIACIDDGVSGPRVQAVYARASDVPDRFGEVQGLIGQYAADVDYRIHRAAGDTGGGRRVRYVTSAGGSCQLQIAQVTLTPSGDDTFPNLMRELREQGHNRSDRKYLVWTDAAVGICGLAQLFRDDRPGADNPNNRGPMYARVDAPCWGYAEEHELLHTMGAVQYTAPNTSNAGHCTDENDVMCYADGSGAAMVHPCSSAPRWQVDCGFNDYFHTNPEAGTYLDQKWNTANSSWLQAADPPPASPSVSLTAPSTMLSGSAVNVSASVSVPAGRTYSIAWTTSRSDCGFDRPNATSTAYWCRATAATSTQVTARVTDSQGLMSTQSAKIGLPVPSSPRGTAVSRSASATRITFGQKTTIAGRLTDAATGRPVIGMPVSLWAAPSGASQWTRLSTVATNRDGRVSFAHAPPRTTAYKLISSNSSTWATARSTAITVGVAPRVTASASSTTARAGSTIAISSRVAPPHAGQEVVLQRRTSTGWTNVARAVLSSEGRARFDVRLPSSTGRLTHRVRKPADADHAVGTSPNITVTAS